MFEDENSNTSDHLQPLTKEHFKTKMETTPPTRFPWKSVLAMFGLLCCVGLVVMSIKQNREKGTSLPVLKISFPGEKLVSKYSKIILVADETH